MIYSITVGQLIGQDHIRIIIFPTNIISRDICSVIDSQVVLPVTHHRIIRVTDKEVDKVLVTDHLFGSRYPDLRCGIDPDPDGSV